MKSTGRPKEYSSAAERQKAYRNRARQTVSEGRELLNELQHAFERSGCWKLCDNLPEQDAAAMRELAKRIREGGFRLVPFRVEERPGEAPGGRGGAPALAGCAAPQEPLLGATAGTAEHKPERGEKAL